MKKTTNLGSNSNLSGNNPYMGNSHKKRKIILEVECSFTWEANFIEIKVNLHVKLSDDQVFWRGRHTKLSEALIYGNQHCQASKGFDKYVTDDDAGFCWYVEIYLDC